MDQAEVQLALHDLTGFEGRCDAILLTPDPEYTPPNDAAVLPQWRRELLALAEEPTEKGGYDLVVVGGGYAGMASALAAARLGCRVALLQDRPVLGGNGSSEVRVWANGLIRRGEFPRIGEIVEEFADHATKSPGRAEEFGDALKEKVVRAEENIDLFLNCHVDQVEVDRLASWRSRRWIHARASVFAVRENCLPIVPGTARSAIWPVPTWEMTPTQRMGMSNMWVWEEVDHAVDFPATPWALDLEMDDFPYPRDHHGEWFWESGFDKDPIAEAEAIRDWNLRAVYGAFNAMKNRGGRAQASSRAVDLDRLHRRATRIATADGRRGPVERRCRGTSQIPRRDRAGTWSIDLHYAKQEYAEKFPDNPFISIAEFDQRVDRTDGYPVPYRCFYSRNIDNLFMAGRCISVTHEALGTVRVMKTCGMMGEVVGKAASLVRAVRLCPARRLRAAPGRTQAALPVARQIATCDRDEPAGDPGRCSGRSSGRAAHGPATVKRIRGQGRQTWDMRSTQSRRDWHDTRTQSLRDWLQGVPDMPISDVVIKGAREHNLRSVDVVLPRNQLICLTGVSGSGKSSLAFDTVYAEGQRRYVESLSSFARHFLGQMPKPEVDYIAGLSPSISISQKSGGTNPRSTVGTITEIYDFLRVLYARIGQGFCPQCGRAITAQSREQILAGILALPEGTRFAVLAPLIRQQKGEYRDLFEDLSKQGFARARVDGRLVRLSDSLQLDRQMRHDIEVVIDRLVAKPGCARDWRRPWNRR